LTKTPQAPVQRSAAAREEWRALAPIAAKAGTLSPDTARAFAFLVEILATERASAAIVSNEGCVVKSASGTLKPHPAVRSLEAARNQAAPLLRKFRLLPGGSIAPKPNGHDRPKRSRSIWRGVLNA